MKRQPFCIFSTFVRSFHFQICSMLKLVKLFLVILSVSFLSVILPAQNVSLTFNVDMSNEIVSPNGVHIAGNFQSAAGCGSNWDPGSCILSDPDGDDVYARTVYLPTGTYEYKFINGNQWGQDESPPSDCSVGATHNRQVVVTNNMNIPPVLFNTCNPVVVFSADLTGQIIPAEGVHVMGNFQEAAGFETNWDPASIEMTDVNADGIYEVRLSVIQGDYQYLTVNGNNTLGAENPPVDCTIDDGNGNRVRPVTILPGTNELPAYIFDGCEISNPAISTNYETYWWNDAVFYEIFVRSFYDSNNDGIGDFQGIIQKLDYLNDGNPETDTDLGITGIWLMPMMKSPSYHGYDATDYYSTEPDYGTMADFEELLSEAHQRGIKVIVDFVMNHTSDQHPWFIQSANNQNGYRNWYVWSATNPGFNGPWGQTVWHYKNGAYYYGLFWGGMPDLNYNHPALKEEMFNITDFWLNKGVDGFRLDAIKYLVEDGTILENTPGTFTVLEEFNNVYKTNNPEAFTVGEVWSNTASVIPYVQNNRLDVCFDFDLAYSIAGAVNDNNPGYIRSQLSTIWQSYPRLQHATFLTNHDMDRIFSQFGSDIEKMKLAASIYLTLPGVPFIYYGEELGMTGTGADENKRRPMQWSAGTNGGFSNVTPWHSLGENWQTNNVAVMETNPESLLQLYKKIIHLRNSQVALRKGYLLQLNNSNDNVLSFVRIFENEAVMVLSNFGTQSSNDPVSMETSSLPPGNYDVTELTNSVAMGTLTINSNGGFTSWQSPGNFLAYRETWLLHLSPKPLEVSLKVLLEGAYNGLSLNAGLSGSPYFPLSQPYNEDPWLYSGNENVNTVPPNVVDWILIELRDAPDIMSAGLSSRLALQAAFLMNDGSVKALDGMSNLQFNASVNHHLFAVIYHRNHLPVISNYPLTESEGIYLYDFSNGEDKAYGGMLAQKQIDNGIWGMISGDSDASGTIDDSDKSSIWDLEAGVSGYLHSDLNLDVQSNNHDKNEFWLPNLGAGSQIPQ